jgi:hypothetical protein
MNERIEAFLHDVLALEGEISSLIREGCAAVWRFMEDSFAMTNPPSV